MELKIGPLQRELPGNILNYACLWVPTFKWTYGETMASGFWLDCFSALSVEEQPGHLDQYLDPVRGGWVPGSGFSQLQDP